MRDSFNLRELIAKMLQELEKSLSNSNTEKIITGRVGVNLG